jgi:hypothetical protein
MSQTLASWFTEPTSTGGGITDDTDSLQAALNLAANTTRFVLVRHGTYRITRELIIPSGVSIVGSGKPLLRQETPGQRLLVGTNVVDVLISGLRCQGPSPSAQFESPFALIDIRATPSSYARNIRILDCEVFSAHSCISATYVDGLWIQRNDVHNFLLYGVLASASTNFHIDDNNIHSSVLNAPGNSYGISATGQSTRRKPQRHCSISNNHISDIPAWDGIMTHDTTDLLITGNTITNVRTGIDVSGFASRLPISNVIISSNYIRLTSMDCWNGQPALATGIIVSGGEGQFISGLVVAQNIIESAAQIKGARPAGNVYGAIQLDKIADAVINSNIIKDAGNEISLAGIGVYRPGDNVTISGNIIDGSIVTTAIDIRHENAGSRCLNLVIGGNTARTTSALRAHTALHRGRFGLKFYANTLSPAGSLLVLEENARIDESGQSGTFAPRLYIGGHEGGVLYERRLGRYTHVDNTVWIHAFVAVNILTSSPGMLTLDGLPFVDAVSFQTVPLQLIMTGLKDSSVLPRAVFDRGTRSVLFSRWIGGNTVPLTWDALDQHLEITLQGFYPIG